MVLIYQVLSLGKFVEISTERQGVQTASIQKGLSDPQSLSTEHVFDVGSATGARVGSAVGLEVVG